jgi:hypothetical protein
MKPMGSYRTNQSDPITSSRVSYSILSDVILDPTDCPIGLYQMFYSIPSDVICIYDPIGCPIRSNRILTDPIGYPVGCDKNSNHIGSVQY